MRPHQYLGDSSRRFYPRWDIRAYTSEMEWTEGAMADFYDSDTRQSIDSFETVAQYSKAGIIAATLLLSLKMHKLPLLRRISNQWTQSIMKLLFVCGVAFSVNYFIEVVYRGEFDKEIYSKIRRKYQAYKITGNIRSLNPDIVLEELPPETDEPMGQPL